MLARCIFGVDCVGLCVCVRACACVCACVCVFVRSRTCAWVQFKCDVTDDCLLQDEPLQLRIFDYDVLSSDDVIGTVCYAPRPLPHLPVSSLSVALPPSPSLSLPLSRSRSLSFARTFARARALSLFFTLAHLPHCVSPARANAHAHRGALAARPEARKQMRGP
jgi:hypothetical protein